MYNYSTKEIPQNEQAREDQTVNAAGGYVFAIDKWTQLNRFLILGCEGGTYYTRAPEITKDNAQNVMACIEENGARAIVCILNVSEGNLAPKNEPALFALALATTASQPAVRRTAWSVLSKVARTGTHLLHFAHYRQMLAGWGRLAREGISRWYTEKSPLACATQVLKYAQRDGWSHRDLLRLAHPKAEGPLAYIFDAVCHPEKREALLPLLPSIYQAYDYAQKGQIQEAIALGATREMLPSEALGKAETWQWLLPKLPATALMRNLGNMTRLCVLNPFLKGTGADSVIARLSDPQFPKQARIHPYSALVALKTYASGGRAGKSKAEPYAPVPQIVDALGKLVQNAFAAVEPTGKRYFIALDISGSMGNAVLEGGLSCAEAGAAVTLALARCEPAYFIYGFADSFRELGITASTTYQDAVARAVQHNFGRTDCALPMLYAAKHGIEVDVFIVITDNETWAGTIHPYQALSAYRNKVNPKAKLAVLAMTATNHTITDPRDAGQLEICGMDSSVPQILAAFAR